MATGSTFVTMGANGSPTTPVQGSIASVGDAVTMPISGGQFATAIWTVSVAGTSRLTLEISIDGGTNWIAPAYSKRIDAVGANPTVSSFANSLPVAETMETPVPANCTHIRLRCATAGTATVVGLAGGALYIPGVPVTAVLADVSAAAAAAIAPTTLDTSGWSQLTALLTGQTASTASVSAVDDTGAVTVALAQAGSAATVYAGIGPGLTTTGGASTASVPVPKRVQYGAPAGTTTGSRVRIEAQR